MDKHLDILQQLLIYHLEQQKRSIMVFCLSEESNYETIKLLLSNGKTYKNINPTINV